MSDQFGSGNSGSGNSGGGGKFGGGGASGGWGDDDAGSAGGAQPDGGQPSAGQPSAGQPSGGQPSGGQPSGGSGQPGGGGGGQSGGGGGGQSGGGGGGQSGGSGGQSGGGGGGQSGGGGGGAGGSGGASGGGAGGGDGAGGGGAAGGAGASGGFKGALGRGAARVANTVESLQIKDTGNAKVDAMGDVFNNALAPFFNAPPPEQGALGYVNQAIGAVMGIQNIGMELMNTGFAMATAGIAAMMPSLPAAFLTVPHIGMPHAHAHPPSLVPPAPPVPLPSIGTLMLAGSVGVLIMGMPAGRCGDLGLAVTCGSFSPAFDVFLGSSNTFIAGNRAARMGDMTRHCNPASAALAVSRGAALFSAAVGAIGVAADAVGGGPVMGAIAQIAADLAAAAMSALLGKDPGIPPSMGALMMGAPTVLIGGFPCPNLPNPLDALMHGLKCVGKAIAKSKGFGKLIKKVGLCNDPSEPISTFTGEVYNDIEDFGDSENGFAWLRHYRSGWSEQDGPLGYGFRHVFQRTLTILRKRAVYETFDNEVTALEKLPDGTFAAIDGFSLRAAGNTTYELRTDRDELLVFSKLGTSPETGRLDRYKTPQVDIYLFYAPDGRLRAVSEFDGRAAIDTHFSYGQDRRIAAVARGPRGQAAKPIASYTYDHGCMVAFVDVLGATTRYAYDEQRRMVRATGPRGYSFHWRYDPRSGRCIQCQGDDGLWGVTAKYTGTQSTFTELDGSVWTFKHYPNGTLSHIVAPDGGVTQYVLDDDGKIVTQVMPNGLEYVWLYDESNRHTGRLDPFGFFVPPEDEEPNPWTSEPDPPSTAREYLCGRPSLQLGKGAATVPGHVSSALQTALARAGVRVTATTPSSYDDAGRLVSEPLPDGNVRTFVYDQEDNVVAEHVGPPGAASVPVQPGTRGGWSTRHYSSWNLLEAEVTPSGSTTRYEYSHRGKWRALLDAVGNRTDYVRDANHRITEIHRYGALYRSYRYGVGGSLVETRGADGQLLVSYEHDERGLPAAKSLGSGERYECDYDVHGRCTKASSSLHQVHLAHQRSRRERDERDGKGIRHEYDARGRLVSTTYFGRFEVQYRYLKRARLQIATPDGTDHLFWLGQQEVVRENGNGTLEALLFDTDQRLVARACWRRDEGANSPFWTSAYRYGPHDTLLIDADNEHPASYEYDDDGRLVAQHDQRGTHRYAYDSANNLIQTPLCRNLVYGQGNLLGSADFDHFYHDAQKRLHQRSHQGQTTTTYVYDSLDQLIEAVGDGNETWRAAYDGLGRRLWREYDGQRTDFYWDGDRLAAERSPSGALRLYVYANEDALVPFMWLDYADESAEPETGRPFFLFTAPSGLPIRVEDGAGTAVWHGRNFEAYGRAANGSPPCPTRLRFAGHYFDEHLGLHYNRFRDYDPALGRYLQPDPLGHAGDINLFAYTRNPLSDVDLRGLKGIHRKPKNKEPGDDRGAEKDSPSRDRKKGKETDLVDEKGNPKKPLAKMSDEELKEFVKQRSEQLNKSLHPEVAKRTTTAVTVVESPPGNKKSRKVIVTSSENKEPKLPNKKKDKGKPRDSALAPDEEFRETPPKLKKAPDTKDNRGRRKPGKGLVDENNEPYPKARRGDGGTGKSEHHAEQRAQRSANDNDESIKAMAPTKKCCDGCQSALRDGGNLDKVPPSLQGTPK